MFSRNPEKERQRLVDEIFNKFSYQEKVFRRGIKVKDVPPNPVIYDLAAGNCEDTVFLRKIFGSYAQIFDFDIKQPTLPLSSAALHFGNGFIQQDIRDVQGCIDAAAGQQPNLIVARAPRVVENVYPSGRVEFNPWWGDTLVEWSQTLPAGGQMFMTAITQMERDFLVAHFMRYGIKGVSMEMPYTPKSLTRSYVYDNPLIPDLPEGYQYTSPTIGRNVMEMKPDAFTFLVTK